jgi:hypothetical protein
MSITSVLPNKGELEAAAIELAVDQAMIEKDWHVTQVLRFFAQTQFQGFQILFSGGTSLSIRQPPHNPKKPTPLLCKLIAQ